MKATVTPEDGASTFTHVGTEAVQDMLDTVHVPPFAKMSGHKLDMIALHTSISEAKGLSQYHILSVTSL